MEYLTLANATPLYFIVGVVLLFVAACCLFFIIRSYQAGLKLGMDKEKLKKTITSSALFTVLPSISILLGVIALSGSLGVPSSWLRLSVVGNLSYEAIAAESAAQGMGITLDSSLMTADSLVTILLVMTTGICWGILCTVFFCRKYAEKCKNVMTKSKKSSGKSFADWAMVAMFIGFCGTFIGAYIAEAARGTVTPFLTALIAAIVMLLCRFLVEKRNISWLENFALALSMLCGMAGAVIIS